MRPRGSSGGHNRRSKTMTDTNTSNRPAYRLYSVTGDGDNARWTDIGVAWKTRDGKGFTLNLNALPLNGRVVMREATSKEAAQ
jgi:hypothetical protein